jgi:hypothetical protein
LRARNIKPGFFKNPELAECPVEARLLFAGLWCLADREGRLEDRPKLIKMEVFPADSFDVDKLLNVLQENGLIHRYVIRDLGAMHEGEIRCIQVLAFHKHQHPHQKEPPSTLPASGVGTSVTRLIPDSGILIPESSPSGREREARPKPERGTRIPDDFGLTPERRAVAEAEKLDPERTLGDFRDYWSARPGAGGRKADWDATWRVWCRRQFDAKTASPRAGGFKTSEQIAKEKFLRGEL